MQPGSRIILLAAILPLLAGCSQTNSSGPTFPWQRQAPVDPLASSGAGDNSSYFAEMHRRAEEQMRFAEEQQRQMALLRSKQQQQEQQAKLAAEQQRSRLEEDYAKRNSQLNGRYGDLEKRAIELDSTNRDMHAQFAQAQQRTQVLEDELNLLRQRLDDTTRQLADARRSGQAADQRLQALQASARRRSGASITANNSVTRDITAVMVPGMDVRQDGDLVRISLPADRLFTTGTATLHQGAQPYLDQVANVVVQHYPRQIVGVEAHTDPNTQLTGTLWRNQHQLTAAQAMAVFEQMTSRHGMSPQQLFVLGHGSNHPIASGGTPEGQAINRRVEIVIYPEMYSR